MIAACLLNVDSNDNIITNRNISNNKFLIFGIKYTNMLWICCIIAIIVLFLLWSRFVSNVHQLEKYLIGWGTPKSPWCLHDLAPPRCSFLLDKITIPPSFNTNGFDVSEAKYAITLVGHFEAFLGSGHAKLNIPGMGSPMLISSGIYVRGTAMPANVGMWHHGNDVHIAVRGTYAGNFTDFHTDISYAQQIPIIWGGHTFALHSGFYKLYMLFRNKVKKNLQKPTNIFIAGHSLGAAIAFIMALDLALSGVSPNIFVYGIAPPRAGDQKFANLVSEKTVAHSVINIADLVTSLPWSYMPNSISSDHPYEFAHVKPLHVFQQHEADIVACHMLPAYYAGIANAVTLQR